MTFKSINSSEEETRQRLEKNYFKLLAFGIVDFKESYQIVEKFRKNKISENSKDSSIDLLAYEHLTKEKIPESDFSVKHILSLTFKKDLELEKKLSNIENIYPQRTRAGSMVPGPIHFGPLEGFLSGSFSNLDFKTLVFTIGSWVVIYGLIFYFLYL